MMSSLPRWIEFGAFVLALVAGCINVIGLLGFEHQAVSHLSGTASLLGNSLAEGSFERLFALLAVLMAFLLGAGLSGFLLHGSTLKLGRHYDTLLVIESALIFLALYLLSQGSSVGHLAASAACGTQNALVTRYSGAIVRTTHLTGIFTDLGIMLGSRIRGEPFDRRRAILFLIIIVGFVVGGTSGAWLYSALGFTALAVPGGICALLAIVYRAYLRRLG